MESSLIGCDGECGCGKEHKITTGLVIIESGATKRFGEAVRLAGLTPGGIVVCDSNTKTHADMLAVGFPSILRAGDIISLDANGLHATEELVAELRGRIPERVPFMVAAGAGTVHDLVRYIAHERKIPFISYPTACCTDAFASHLSLIARNGMIQTAYCTGPVAVVADTCIFTSAPYRLTAAGISDMFSKYTSLADWKCAGILAGEGFCEKICGIVERAVTDVRANLPAIHAREPDACETLMRSLIDSGLVMQMWGDSRPVSGSEHHFAYFWDMDVLNSRLDALHGEQLGVGLLITLRHYGKIRTLYDIGRTMQPYGGMPLEYMRKKLGTSYESVLKANQPDILRSVDQGVLAEKFPDIQKIISELPKAGTLRPVMKAAGCLTTCEEIGLDRNLLPDYIGLAPFSRSRLTLMRVSQLLPMKQ